MLATRKLSPEQMRKTHMQRAGNLMYLRNSFTLLHGRMGSGKTTYLVGLASWASYYFGVPTVQLAGEVGLHKEVFGPYTRLTPHEFVEQLILLSNLAIECQEGDITEQSEVHDHFMYAKKRRGLHLYNCILLADEAQNIANSLRSNERLTVGVSGFVTQMRHYKITMLSATPNPANLVRGLRDQVKFACKPEINSRTKWIKGLFRGPVGKFQLDIYAPDFWDMFNSWQPNAISTMPQLEKMLEHNT